MVTMSFMSPETDRSFRADSAGPRFDAAANANKAAGKQQVVEYGEAAELTKGGCGATIRTCPVRRAWHL